MSPHRTLSCRLCLVISVSVLMGKNFSYVKLLILMLLYMLFFMAVLRSGRAPTFDVSTVALERAHRTLQFQVHPDRFAAESSQVLKFLIELREQSY